MFLQDLAFFVLEKRVTGLTLGEDKHDPYSNDIEDQVICEDWRDISVPNLTVIQVKLQAVH